MLDPRSTLDIHGLSDARSLAADKQERIAIDTAARFRDHGPCGGVVRVSLVTAALPHKSPSSPLEWTRTLPGGASLSLLGARHADGTPIGVPYGSKARMMLFFLQDQYLRTGDPRVRLGPSRAAWFKRIGSPGTGGATYRMIEEQWRRIATSCFSYDGEPCGTGPLIKSVASSEADEAASRDSDKADLHFPREAILSEDFSRTIESTGLSVSRYALYCLANNSAALDLYLCLAWRLPRLERAFTVTWPQVASTFATGFRNPVQVRVPLLRALQMVLAVYPQARVAVSAEGLMMEPSEAPATDLVP